MLSLPFSIPLLGGIGKADGLVRLEGAFLVLEFELQDATFGLIKSDLKDLRIPLTDVDRLALKIGWFTRPKLVVQTTSMRVSRLVPGSEQGTFQLSLNREHRLAARHFISAVEARKRRSGSSQEAPRGLE